MQTLCVVQARTGSTRLPGKVLADVGGRPMLRYLLERLEPLTVDEIVVATSSEARDDPIAEIATAAGRPVVRGSEHDVLDRFVSTLDAHPAQHVVRITADCPLTDPALVDAVVAHHRKTKADYTTNTLPRTFPKGLDVEVASADALRVAHAEATTTTEREHVMPFLYRRPERFRLANLRNNVPLGDERWTVDTAEDLAVVRDIADRMGERRFGWRDVLSVVGQSTAATTGSVSLRPAYPSDAEFVRNCRNDDDAVRFSVTGCAVTRADHERWFEARLASPGHPMWIGEAGGEPVGTVRLDVRTAVGEVAIALHRAMRGRGFGRGLLSALLEQVGAEQQVVELVARVHNCNTASMRTFLGAGFEIARDEGEFVTLRRDPRLPIEEA
jgi:spore coat polysaccharide biosynthesis protein SpsF (cytidylyltransferase family)/GNAT superfamily N-acetyltransferase